MTMNLLPCQGNLNTRQCVYVAWGDTEVLPMVLAWRIVLIARLIIRYRPA